MPNFFDHARKVEKEDDRKTLTENSPSSSSTFSISRKDDNINTDIEVFSTSNEITTNLSTVDTNYFDTDKQNHNINNFPSSQLPIPNAPDQLSEALKVQIIQGQPLAKVSPSYLAQQGQASPLPQQIVFSPNATAGNMQNIELSRLQPQLQQGVVLASSTSSPLHRNNSNVYTINNLNNNQNPGESSRVHREIRIMKKVPGRNTFFQRFLSKYLFLDFLHERAAFSAFFIFLSLFLLFVLTIVEHLIIMNHKEENHLIDLFDDDRRNEIFYDDNVRDTDYGSYYFLLVLLFSCKEATCDEYEVPITILVLNTLTYVLFFFLVYVSLKNNRARYNFGTSRFGICCTCCCVPLHAIYAFVLIQIKIYCIYWMYVWSDAYYIDDDELDDIPVKNYGSFTWWVIALNILQFPWILVLAQITNTLRNMDTFVDQHYFSSDQNQSSNEDPEAALDRKSNQNEGPGSYTVTWVVNNKIPRRKSNAIEDTNVAIVGVGGNMVLRSSGMEKFCNCCCIGGIYSLFQLCICVTLLVSFLGVISTGLTATTDDAYDD